MRAISAVAAAFSLLAGPAAAAEGFWPLDAVPLEAVREATGVTPAPAFVERLRKGAVRLASNGCSASLVSPDGLVLTNHHCVLECARALSDVGRDYMAEGFLTDDRRQERTCPGIQGEVLVEISDVTARVKAAAPAERERVLAAAERDACRGLPGYRCYGIDFFRGGVFKVYRYRRYEDVRLVFAPEFAATFFGGDPDNFNFPRHAFDAAFLRLYDDGRPARTREHLRLARRAPAAGEPAFLVGSPGRTQRLLSVAQLQALRDVAIPLDQLHRAELRGRLIQFGRAGEDERRAAAHALFKLENSFKVYQGRVLALGDERFMAARRAEEAALRAAVAADAALAGEVGDPWAELEAVGGAYAERYAGWRQLEGEPARASRLFGWARTLVRGARERAKPGSERMAEFADSRLADVRHKLLDDRPVEPRVEQIVLEHWLLKTRELLGPAQPSVRALLGQESPEALAARLVAGTSLADPKVRERLWKGGLRAIEASDDPMIRFVLAAEPFARGERELWRREVVEPTDAAAERLAQARFAVLGEAVYPDATFSPRLSFGRVEGWTWRGATVEPFTTVGGLYDRATGVEPYALPPRWIAARGKIDPATVLDFTASTEVIGGSSGSPLVDVRGEVIGVAFDGNIHSLGGAYGYDSAANRTVAVSSQVILVALDRVYNRAALVAELTGR